MVCAVLVVIVKWQWFSAGFMDDMFEREKNIGHVVGGTFRSETTVRTANISYGVFEYKLNICCQNVNYLYGPLQGEKGKRLGNGSISRVERPEKEFMSSGNQ